MMMLILCAFIAGYGLGRRGPTGPDPEMGPEWVARMYAEDYAVFLPAIDQEANG